MGSPARPAAGRSVEGPHPRPLSRKRGGVNCPQEPDSESQKMSEGNAPTVALSPANATPAAESRPGGREIGTLIQKGEDA